MWNTGWRMSALTLILSRFGSEISHLIRTLEGSCFRTPLVASDSSEIFFKQGSMEPGLFPSMGEGYKHGPEHV